MEAKQTSSWLFIEAGLMEQKKTCMNALATDPLDRLLRLCPLTPRRQVWKSVQKPAGSTRPSLLAVSGMLPFVQHVSQCLLMLSRCAAAAGLCVTSGAWLCRPFRATAMQCFLILPRRHMLRARCAQTFQGKRCLRICLCCFPDCAVQLQQLSYFHTTAAAVQADHHHDGTM